MPFSRTALLLLFFSALSFSCTRKEDEEVTPSRVVYNRLSEAERAILDYKKGQTFHFVRRFYNDVVDTLTVSVKRISTDTIFQDREYISEKCMNTYWRIQEHIYFGNANGTVFELIKGPAYKSQPENFTIIYENRTYAFSSEKVRTPDLPAVQVEGRTYANVGTLAQDRLNKACLLANNTQGLLQIQGSSHTLSLYQRN